jgi:hypothetical protein
MINDNVDDPDYMRGWNAVVKALQDNKVNLSIAANIAVDILLTCGLTAHDGDQKLTAAGMRKFLLPELNTIIEKLEKEEYNVTTLNLMPDLEQFDVSQQKPN